ncbi:MAG TPA: hypothetical protein VMM36_16450, partial [Opitutaceae bacterium]|nr:hypothetical protein [Opitutaceae bacterium]
AGAADQYFMETGASAVAISALYGNTEYIAGDYSVTGPTASNPTFTFNTSPITTTMSELTATAIAGTGRSLVHNK